MLLNAPAWCITYGGSLIKIINSFLCQTFFSNGWGIIPVTQKWKLLIQALVYLITGLPVRPGHKMGFRSSAAKNGLPGEGRRLFSHMVSYEFLLHGALHGYFVYLVSAPPEKLARRCEPEESYLHCSKRFDHGSHSMIFLLFEFQV